MANGADLVKVIRANGWWQGAVIEASSLQSDLAESYLVLISQTCNLFNTDFTKVPQVEFVVAKVIDTASNEYLRGDHPRTLHVKACAMHKEVIALEILLHERIWLDRKNLASGARPLFSVRNLASNEALHPDVRVDWLDRLASWLARSYTRVALPDAFNDAMKVSKIDKVLESKLITSHHEELHGIFLTLSNDDEHRWAGLLGEMPGPYILGITIVTEDTIDPEPFRKNLVSKIFFDSVQDGAGNQTTRAELARCNGIRILEVSIDAKTMSLVSLKDLEYMIRYTFVDHLSTGAQRT